MRKIRYLVLLCMAFSSACFAQMQWYPPIGVWSGPAQLNNQIILDSLNQSYQSTTNDSEEGEGPSSETSVTYTPSAARTRANLQDFADKTRAMDPEQADKMEALFAQIDVIAEIDKVLGQFGLSKDNAADAFAVYWVSAWQAANSDTSTASAQTYQAVAKQSARGLTQSAEFRTATDAQKQQMAEALLVQTALIDASREAYAADPGLMKALAKAVKQGAAVSGLELEKMTLTEEGFREN